MDWRYWKDKEVFVQLKTGAVYSGIIIDIDLSSEPLIFITIIDKYNNRVVFLNSEIVKLKEEVLRKK